MGLVTVSAKSSPLRGIFASFRYMGAGRFRYVGRWFTSAERLHYVGSLYLPLRGIFIPSTTLDFGRRHFSGS